LTNIVGAFIGRTAVYNLEEIANINQAVCLIRLNESLINSQYFLFLANTDLFIKKLNDGSVENARANVSLRTIGNLFIPLPSLEEQAQIVAELEADMAVVNGAKRLREKMQAKINGVIAKVWG
jgi:type I restriction enzyme S subunit